VETRDEYTCLALQLDHGQEFYRVDRKVMTRQVQEESYRILVQRYIARLRESLARTNDPDPRVRIYAQQGIDTSLGALHDLTGQHPIHSDDPEEWIRWWEDYHKWLRLAPDGRRVIVDPGRR
jgi:hypothetical protein